MSALAEEPKPFTPLDRKLALMARKIEQREVARELGVSVDLVSRVMRGRSLYEPTPEGRKVARRIAQILDRPLELVFPELGEVSR
jgi:transcriptional regulator with XRE-family HTH domain